MGCDVGAASFDRVAGPDLELVASYPEDGAGTECRFDSPPDCGVPVDAAIELRFSHYLLPRTAVRQSISVYSGSPENRVFLQPRYDVIERVVRYVPTSALEPRVLYTVELLAPEEDDSFGFRAYDGAPLGEGRVPLSFSFRTARQGSVLGPAPEPAAGCQELFAHFDAAGCTLATCHGTGGDPAMDLRLDSASALRQTAIRQVAHQTELGGVMGRPLVAGPRFGLRMPVIEPGSAARSYLFYKLLINRDNFGTGEEACSTRYTVELPNGACLWLSPAERRRLGDWFVQLDPMPPAGSLSSLGALRSIQRFIDDGASLSECE